MEKDVLGSAVMVDANFDAVGDVGPVVDLGLFNVVSLAGALVVGKGLVTGSPGVLVGRGVVDRNDDKVTLALAAVPFVLGIFVALEGVTAAVEIEGA